MGLLDDAIREHLDLKRRRGGDPGEVARLEQEALGPVRREPVPGDAADDHGEQEPAGQAPPEPQPGNEPHPADPPHPADDHTHVLAPSERHEGAHGDPLSEQKPDDDGGGGSPSPADRAGGAGEDDSATPLAESPHPTTGPARSSADPEQELPAQDPRHSDIVHQPTTEFRVEDHHDDEPEAHAPDPGEQPAAPAEDVLEETPDFLQETPEHDRLWFEQRPPRDFDFDG